MTWRALVRALAPMDGICALIVGASGALFIVDLAHGLWLAAAQMLATLLIGLGRWVKDVEPMGWLGLGLWCVVYVFIATWPVGLP